MFDVGIWELALILVLSLIIIGPKRLPEVAAKLGSLLAKLRQAQKNFHHIFSHYSNYPNAGKHLLDIDKNSENYKDLLAIKDEFEQIKQKVSDPIKRSESKEK